jgi:hypothetical protein
MEHKRIFKGQEPMLVLMDCVEMEIAILGAFDLLG